VLANNAAIASKVLGVYLRGAENTQVSNMTIVDTAAGSSGNGLAADHSSLNYITDAAQCNASASPCGNGASSTFVVNSLAGNNAGAGFSIGTTLQEGGWGIDHSNAHNNSRNYLPSSHVNITNSGSIDPLLGACKVWIPASSPLKGAGLSGGDKGANILYRHQNGVLTSNPLWDPATGKFPHGTLVVGVNDVTGKSAFDVHQRLNVNTSGCAFPAGYAQ
jgi:hypothetical protein